ncbi:hypothetical protein OHA21_47070 [Actinoplanes sp. NBC_00393]|uniref:hypothetical protein n=1 Tax=Actinoplanes sp. NBC_00393 TaxID=2975953 RepID=UPI002E1F704A
MSLLQEQRVRITFNPQGFFAPERPWEASCPCCQITSHTTWLDAFATWAQALAWAQSHLRQHHCRFCIDHIMPAGRHDALGELFESCPVCTLPCGDCDGTAVYPATYNTPTELVSDLADLRLVPVFCDSCDGVIAVVPLDPEVYA